jgi:hypothetical protein
MDLIELSAYRVVEVKDALRYSKNIGGISLGLSVPAKIWKISECLLRHIAKTEWFLPEVRGV